MNNAHVVNDASHLETMSDAGNQTLIYLPGLDGTGRLLHRQQELFDRYRVLCESYPQDRPQTYEELADTAAEHFRETAGGEKAIVLAESFGGAVALTLALRHPELIQRMLLVNTFARFSGRLRIRLASFFGRFLPRRPAPRASRPLRSLFFFSKEISRDERDEFWKRTADVPMQAFGYRLRMIAKLDLRPRLQEIQIPSLVLTAPDDRVVPAKAGRELARMLPGARLLVCRVGHGAMIHPMINIAQLLAEPEFWPAATAS